MTPTAYGKDDKVRRNRGQQRVPEIARVHSASEATMVWIDENRSAEILAFLQQVCETDSIEVAGQNGKCGAAHSIEMTALIVFDRIFGADRRALPAPFCGQVSTRPQDLKPYIPSDLFRHSRDQPNLELKRPDR